MIDARLYGSFALQAPDGTDLTPHRSAKAQGLLALLLMAPNFERSRDYLADKLWSDRSASQAAGSLKTELYEIRRALGAWKDLLRTRHGHVGLDRNSIRRDIDAAGFAPEPGAEFLESLRVRDPEFTDWLRQQRAEMGRGRKIPGRPRLLMRGTGGDGDIAHEMFLGGFSHSIEDWCAEKLVEADTADPDLVPDDGIDFVLRHSVSRSSEAVTSNFAMVRARDNLFLWNHADRLPTDASGLYEDWPLHKAINHRVDRTLFELAPEAGQSREALYFRRSTLGAVRLLFRNRGADMAIARRYLRSAQDATGRGLHCAWLAYSLCFDKAEANVRTESLRDEAEALCRRALELEPFNGMTLALVSYVSTLILQQPRVGLDLADQAIGINRSNPLAWSFRAAALYNLGDIHSAVIAAAFARRIAGNGPYRYAVETFYCIAASLASQVDDAIRAGEIAAMLKPDFRASLRYLAMLYSHQRDEEKLEQVVRTLRKAEPDFSVRKMLEMSEYPSEILRKAPMSPL